MKQLVEATASIAAKLAIIREKAENINLVVTTITKVADQTNWAPSRSTTRWAN